MTPLRRFHEVKPDPYMLMRDNAILQSGSRAFGEPVLGWSDDMKDMFNQLFTKISQRFLTTILWRDSGGYDYGRGLYGFK